MKSGFVELEINDFGCTEDLQHDIRQTILGIQIAQT